MGSEPGVARAGFIRPDLSGRTALVTGAAKRLGRSIALGLAACGADLIVHYGRSDKAAREVVRQAESMGRRAFARSADLRSPSEIDDLFDALGSDPGALDIMVNSAAVFESQPLGDVEAADWDRSLDVNLRAPFLCAKRGAELMARARNGADEASVGARGGGLIVNIADLSGVHPWRDHFQHGVSKAGLLHLTRVLARSLAPQVRVNAIVPGSILPPPGMSPDSAEWASVAERVPLRRTGDPEDIRDAVLFFAASPFVTGAVLRVDGGEGLLGPVGH